MKIFFGLVLPIILALSCNQPNANFFEVKKGKQHEISSLKLSINDMQWDLKQDAMGVPVIIMRPHKTGDVFLENVNVLSEYVYSMSLEEYYQINAKQLQLEMQSFKAYDTASVTIDGIRFKKLIYSFTQENKQLMSIAYLGIRDNIGIVVSAAAMDSTFAMYQKQLEAIAESIRFLPIEKDRYYNSMLGMSFKPINEWQIRENVQGIPVFFISPQDNEQDAFQENINVVSEPTDGITIEEYYIANMQGIDAYVSNFKLIQEPKELTIDNHVFKSLIYSHQSQEFDVIVMVYFTVINGKGYVVNCSALQSTFASYKPKFEEIVQSLQFE